MKKIFTRIIIFCLVCVLLDFIPIKKAIYENKLNFMHDNYLCSFAQVTGGNWEIEYTLNNSSPLFFENLQGKNPFNYLDKNFTTDYMEPSGNKYVFSGTIMEKEDSIFDLKVKSWDIVYPIQRKSIRMLYAPKSYLTIYDFDWVKIIGRILH